MSSQNRPRRGAKAFGSLLTSVAGARVAGNQLVEVAGLAYDSRRVEPGWVFVAVRGERNDGHDFIAEAVKRGAVGLVVEAGREAGMSPPPGGAMAVVANSREAMAAIARAFYDDPSSKLTLAGVTGTNGKTTTALLIDAIFRAAGHESGVIGTLEYRIGARQMRAPHTTPEAIDLQGLLAGIRWREMATTHVVALAGATTKPRPFLFSAIA